MQQSPWEANRFAARQEIPLILWNPKVHYRIHKCPRPVPILSQLDPVPARTSYFLKIHLILSSHLWLCLPSGLFPSGVPTKNLYTPLLSPHALHAPPISFFLDFITRTILVEQYRSFKPHIMQFPQLPCYPVTLRPKYYPQQPIFEHLQRAILPQCERPSFTPIQNKRQNYNNRLLKLPVVCLSNREL